MQLVLAGSAEMQFRRLGSKEVVHPGDYVKDDDGKYQPWDGPRGFQASSFHQEVFRPETKK